MPAHYPSPLNEQKVWDVVNFVLALPYEPELLKDAGTRPAGHGSGLSCGRPVMRGPDPEMDTGSMTESAGRTRAWCTLNARPTADC